MTTTALRCPGCTEPLTGTPRCAQCNLLLFGPTAARLWEVELEIGRLSTERQKLLQQLREESAQPVPAWNPTVGAQRQTAPAAWTPPPGKQSFTGQQILLGLGGILVVLGAIVFAAVAWEDLGAWGQLLLVGMLTTGLASGAGAASSRGLTQSAEALAGAASGLLAVSLVSAHRLGLVQVESSDWVVIAAVTTTLITGALWLMRREIRAFGIASVLAAQTITPTVLVATETSPMWYTPLIAAAGVLGTYLGSRTRGAVGAVSIVTGSSVALLAGAAGLLQSYSAESGEHLTPLLGSLAALTASTVLLGAAHVRRGAEKTAAGILGGLLAGAALHSATQILEYQSTRPLEILLGLAGIVATTRALKSGHRAETPIVATATTIAALATVNGDAGQAAILLVAAAAGAAWQSWKQSTPWAAGASVALLLTGLAAGAVEVEQPLSTIGIGLAGVAAALSMLGWTLERSKALEVETSAAGGTLLALLAAHTIDAGTTATVLWIAAATLTIHSVRPTRPHVNVAAAVAAAGATGYTLLEAGAGRGLTSGILLLAAAGALALSTWKRLEEDQVGHEVLAGTIALYTLLQAMPEALTLSWTLWGTAALVLLDAVRRDRGLLGPVGVVLAAAGNAVLLANEDVTTVEAYTLPLAVGLLAVGLVHEHRQRKSGKSAPSWLTVGPAASAALLPSALVALEEGGMRAALALLAAAIMLIIGLLGRLQALLLVPGAVALVLGWELLAPIAAQLPRWVTLVAVGLGLLAVGVSYEARLNDLRRAGNWVKSLR